MKSRQKSSKRSEKFLAIEEDGDQGFGLLEPDFDNIRDITDIRFAVGYESRFKENEE